MKDIRRNLLPPSATLREVMTLLNQGVYGAVLIVDEGGVMRGLFTDGDIRRALLGGATLDAFAEQHMQRKYTTGSTARSHSENLALLSKSIRHVPILDELGRPVEMISWAEIWRLPVMEPSLGGNELKYASDCITSGWISSQGEYVGRFEKAFCEFGDAQHSLCVSSGTTALHLALVALGIGPGDEVIVPNLTFAATANVVMHCGARPVFADVSRATWTVTAADIEPRITPRTKAIIPVHLYGHPCDMDPILELAKRHGLKVIEDAAEALGAEYKGRKVGTLGDVGCFSFFANKVITTGEGGMTTTNDRALHEHMQVLRDHGMQKSRRYWHLFPGFNYRMTNLQAAIGLAQMERIDAFLDNRQQVARRYNERLGALDGIILPPEAEWARNIYWLYSILIDEQRAGVTRDQIAARLGTHGIDSRPFFYPVNIMPPYEWANAESYPVTEWISARGLSLPTSKSMSVEDVDRVCTEIEAIVGHHQVMQAHT